jgi:ketosteroid isomerase-like protein
MSQENVELVRAIYDAWDRGDPEAVFELIDPEVEWYGPPDVSGSGLSRGHEGVLESMTGWLSTWDEYHFEMRELIDLGDVVLTEGWQRGRGRGSGVEVAEGIFSVWTLRAGKAVRQRMFRDRQEALDAVGLRE